MWCSLLMSGTYGVGGGGGSSGGGAGRGRGRAFWRQLHLHWASKVAWDLDWQIRSQAGWQKPHLHPQGCVCVSTRAHLLFCPALAKQILTARSADRDIGKLKGDRGVSAQWWQSQSSALFLSYQNRGGAPKGKSFRKGLLEATSSQDTSH